MLRAVAYQLSQSVLAWLHLGSDEVLFLEGAEDFDVVGPDEARAVQVFDTSRLITLRTPKVLAAISNFWRLAVASPAQLLRAHTFLLYEMPSVPWFLHIEQAFAQMVTSGWHRAAKSPLALVNPRAGLGDLRKELDGHTPGLVKAARVIRAAIPLVGLRVHKQIIEQIQKCAGDKAGNSEE
jgi:hypothetical protein